jgi:hypothetical protein
LKYADALNGEGAPERVRGMLNAAPSTPAEQAPPLTPPETPNNGQ